MGLSLETVNAASAERCVALLEGLVERSAWVLRDVPAARPFGDPEAVAAAIEAAIRAVDGQARLTLLRAHPELAGAEARSGDMTPASQGEQGRLGLTALSGPDHARLTALNAAYRARFGFPYVVALHRLPDLPAVFADFERRLLASPDHEPLTALDEIVSVMRARCARLFAIPPAALNPAQADAPAPLME